MMLNLKNVILFLVALQILNIGLFVQNTPVLATYYTNQINSVTEYLAEITLGIKDAFPENNSQNKSDKNSSHSSFHFKLLQVQLYKSNNNIFSIDFYHTEKSTYNKSILQVFYKNVVTEINSPPPKLLV